VRCSHNTHAHSAEADDTSTKAASTAMSIATRHVRRLLWSSLPCVPRHSLLLLTRDLPSSPWLPDHKSRQRVEYLRRRLLGPAFIHRPLPVRSTLIYLRLNVTVTTDAAGNAHPTSGVSAHLPIRPAER